MKMIQFFPPYVFIRTIYKQDIQEKVPRLVDLCKATKLQRDFEPQKYQATKYFFAVNLHFSPLFCNLTKKFYFEKKQNKFWSFLRLIFGLNNIDRRVILWNK